MTDTGEGGIPHAANSSGSHRDDRGPTGGRGCGVGLPEWTEADVDHLRLREVAKYREAGSGGLPQAVLSRVDVERVVRPASEIRRDLRGDFDDRVRWLRDMADGEVMEKAVVDVSEIAPWVACPNCGEVGLVPKAGGKREVVVERAASVRERREAIEALAKYGLGQLKEVSVENVRERVGRTVSLARQMFSAEVAEQFVEALKPIWKDG